ncbi:MAG: cytochrome b N-terminal domain-containing protein [Candidatus Lambdaproteobacteria bacterium]|nr:cytochrome b N-terminal domain-containing protein [Candidatus Lambdaproteobacteria bacterium]
MTEPVRTRSPFFETRPRAAAALDWLILPVDRLLNRLYTSRCNPLYQTGSLALVFLGILAATGLYLLIFYKVRTPYESVAALEADPWVGRWVRALHSYAGDAMMVATAVHALRMLLEGRTWGPRALAWITGVLMLGVVLLSAWTGLVLVWDVQGQVIAVEGARLLDSLPIFSEPITRSFISPEGVPASFFFLNLMLHLVFPFLVIAFLWLHTVRVARPVLLPPRRLTLWAAGLLLALGLAWPVGMSARADALALPGRIDIDWFFAFWLALGRNATPGVTLLAWLALGALALSVPWWWRPSGRRQALPAVADELLCTGCTQCYKDCPYEAINMVPAPPENTATPVVARVNPALCVSCGICAGSCAPMVIGPPGRTGRDHLLQVQAFHRETQPKPTDVVALACMQGLGPALLEALPEGVHGYPLHCAAAFHTSAVEYLLRRGVAGVFIVGCPHRHGQYREGSAWIQARLYEEREAELQPRVDKSRVRLAALGGGELAEGLAALKAFRAELLGRAEPPTDQGHLESAPECELPQASHG